jgi:phosphotransferase system enzyme I (PtsI)
MNEVQGIAVSPGYAVGRVLRIRSRGPAEKRTVGAAQVSAEAARLSRALAAAEQEIGRIAAGLRQRGLEQEAEIVGSQLLLLHDEELIGRALALVSEERRNAEAAMQQAADEAASLIESLDDPYLRERAVDIRDAASRVIGHLQGEGEMNSRSGGEPAIVVAEELTPTQTAQLDLAAVAGIVTIGGGAASHSAIIARSLGIPAVAGAGEALAQLENGAVVAVDGSAGRVVVGPPKEMAEEFAARRGRHLDKLERYAAYVRRETVTSDGVRVLLAANIGAPHEAEFARGRGAEGVGLFRTEYLFMGRSELPAEDEQFEAYRAAVRAFEGTGGAVVIRTMDIGGDKELPLLGLPKEDNPFLGFRAIRIGLERPELLKTQLRAILRASAYGDVKVMFPMIATLAEWRAADRLLAEARAELAAAGAQMAECVERGMMIEVPAAALLADRFAREADFFSIGTNDLAQYTMAANRMNGKVAHLGDPLHPAVLRLIDGVIRAAHRHGRRVAMCGEMAGDLYAVPLLLAMGLDEFSLSSIAIARTRALLAQLSRAGLTELPEAALELDSAEEVRRLVERRVPQLASFL